jgi:hypothetical protein
MAQSPYTGGALSNDSTWGVVGFNLFHTEGERPPLGQMPCFSVEGSSPRWAEPDKWGFCPCQRGLFHCHGDDVDYECSGGRAPMPGLKGLESGIRELSC